MDTKRVIKKPYIIAFSLCFIGISIIFGILLIGFFTSQRDDKQYVSLIKNDLETMKNNPGEPRYKIYRNSVTFGFIFFSLSNNRVKLIQPPGSSKVNLLKYANNVNSDNALVEVLAAARKRPYLDTDLSSFVEAGLMHEEGLFSSFGDAFSYRLLSTTNRVMQAIKEFVMLSKEDEGSFSTLAVLDRCVSLTLYEKKKVGGFKASNVQYEFKDIEDHPSLEEILTHVLYRIF